MVSSHTQLCMIKGWASFAIGDSPDTENCMRMIEREIGVSTDVLAGNSYNLVQKSRLHSFENPSCAVRWCHGYILPAIFITMFIGIHS